MTTDAALVEQAVSLARRMLADSLADATRAERRRQHRLGRLLADPQGRELLFALTDEVVRIESPGRAARRFAAVVREHPTTALGAGDRLLLRVGAWIASLLPALVMPLVVWRIRRETRGIVLPAEDPGFARHLQATRRGGRAASTSTRSASRSSPTPRPTNGCDRSSSASTGPTSTTCR